MTHVLLNTVVKRGGINTVLVNDEYVHVTDLNNKQLCEEWKKRQKELDFFYAKKNSFLEYLSASPAVTLIGSFLVTLSVCFIVVYSSTDILLTDVEPQIETSLFEERLKQIEPIQEAPKRMSLIIETGASVRISATETASVYGHDVCPENKSYWAETAKYPKCVLLRNNQTVDVNLIVDMDSFNETWSVSDKTGELVITRPNGWIVSHYKRELE